MDVRWDHFFSFVVGVSREEMKASVARRGGGGGAGGGGDGEDMKSLSSLYLPTNATAIHCIILFTPFIISVVGLANDDDDDDDDDDAEEKSSTPSSPPPK